ncbi:MAG: polysaccharide pyruvyl transferase family protein [Bacillota bacterium]|nr:polysaccharide pyruvyl transferase family protein [Bacillota bacterium]
MINLYYHMGCTNHGCEAIVRSTNKILGGNLNVYTSDIDSDQKYKLNEIVNLKEDVVQNSNFNSINRLFAKFYAKFKKSDILFTKYRHLDFFNNINKNDIYLSVGGDDYCYAGKDILWHYNKLIHNKGGKTVLFGCSFEPSDINEDTIPDIQTYDLIISRETESYNALKAVNPNTLLFPDPAFQLDKADVALPEGFVENNTIGINVSPLILNCESTNGSTMKNYEEVIKYILKETDLKIALLPHVVEPNSDDREALKILFDLFKDSGRVLMIPDCNCMQLKTIISKCRFLITARTHASIAGYSTCVPTIVVGYSVKARGIAKDIFGTDNNYVIPVQKLKNDEDLTNAFIWLLKNENNIKEHLASFIPAYCNKVLEVKEKVMELYNK